MNKLYYVFPIQGPINGVKIIAREILKRLEKEQFPVLLVDTAQAKDHKDFGSFSLKKVVNAFRFFKLIPQISSKDTVYLNLTPNGLSFYRDLAFLKLAQSRGAQCFIHIHANGLEKKSNWAKKALSNVHCIVINTFQYQQLDFIKNRYLVPNALPDFFTHQLPEKSINPSIRLLFISNFSQKKGIDRLRELAHWIEEEQLNCELILAGGVLDDYSENILQQLQAKDFVRFLGFVSDKSEKMKLIAEADVVLMLSDENYEVFPLIYIESFMAGTLVLTTPQIVDSDFIKEQVALRFNKDNFMYIYQSLQNQATKDEFSNRARNYFLQKMEFEQFYEQIKSIITHAKK